MDEMPQGVIVVEGVEYVTMGRAAEMIGITDSAVRLALPRIRHLVARYPGGISRYLLEAESVLHYKRTRKRGRPPRVAREVVGV